MRAQQVKQEPEVKFGVPLERKGGICDHCKAPVDDYRGIRVGTYVWCSYLHMSQSTTIWRSTCSQTDIDPVHTVETG